MKNPWLGLIFSVLCSLVLFQYLWGWEVLNPHFTSWLLQGDPSQHFFGFNFFLQEDWQWPPGKIRNYDWPQGTSIVYTDSIPWVSLPLKVLFSHSIFQFHGLWILLCFLLQGAGAYWFLLQACASPLSAALGSILISVFPSFLFRAFDPSRHYSCLAHFLIFPALALTFSAILKPNPRRQSLWICLLFVSIGIHFYFFLINCFFWIATEGKLWKSHKGSFVGIMAGLLACMTIFGYFVIPVTRSIDGGFASYSMNLLSWFNSEGYSILGLSLPTVSGDQREGFQYLGLGSIYLLCTSLWQRTERNKLKQFWHLVRGSRFEFLLYFILFLALSIRLSVFLFALYDWITGLLYLFIVTIALKKAGWKTQNAVLLGLAGLLLLLVTGRLLRSSGRAGWYLSYSLLFILFYLKPKRAVLISAVMLQLMDVFPMLRSIRAENQKILLDTTTLDQVAKFDQAGLSDFVQGSETLRLVGLTPSQQSPVALFALKQNLRLGPVYVARGHLKQEGRDQVTLSQKNLENEKIEVGTTYVSVNPELNAKLLTKAHLSSLPTGAYLWIKQLAND